MEDGSLRHRNNTEGAGKAVSWVQRLNKRGQGVTSQRGEGLLRHANKLKLYSPR